MTKTNEQRAAPPVADALPLPDPTLGATARPSRSVRLGRRIVGFRSSARILLFLLVVAFLTAWEFASRAEFLIDPLFVSRPTEIAAAVPDLLGDEDVRDALAATGGAVLRAFLLGTVAGIVLGYVLGSFRLLRDAFYGPLLFLLSVPKSAFIPIFLVFFGINTTTAVYYGAFSGFVYVAVNVVGGLDLVEPRHLTVARAYGASLRHRIVDIIFPASIPGVFTGIWYGIKNALQGVLILELFVSVAGLGQEIKARTNALRTDQVFALILGVSIVAILLGQGWTVIENRLARWKPSSRGAVTSSDL